MNRPKFRPLTEDEAYVAWTRMEDAQRDAMECAAMLAQYFELLAFKCGSSDVDDDTGMFGAMGHEGLALQIGKHLETMMTAARQLHHGEKEGA